MFEAGAHALGEGCHDQLGFDLVLREAKKSTTKEIEIPKNHNKAFSRNHFTLVIKLLFCFFAGVFFVDFFGVILVAIFYVKSANSVPIKLPIATPIPPSRTPQYTFSDSWETIGFLLLPMPIIPLQRCSIWTS